MNKEEYNIISHSLGINEFFEGKLPEEFYRNHFVAGENHTSYNNLEGLLSRGLLSKRKQFDQTVYNVTEKGIKEFKIEYKD